jgi:hypothetical protein
VALAGPTLSELLAPLVLAIPAQVTIERLARRLDGVALALKMAAARASTIGLDAVDAQIERQLAGLDADWNTALPRHRSLLASMRWSYNLLPDDVQRTLRALGVFSGSFSLAGAIAIAGEAAEAHIAELVRRSLVVRDTANRGRYRLLDSMRRFALQQLEAAGEVGAARDRHADFVTQHFATSTSSGRRHRTPNGRRPTGPKVTICVQRSPGRRPDRTARAMSSSSPRRSASSCRSSWAPKGSRRWTRRCRWRRRRVRKQERVWGWRWAKSRASTPPTSRRARDCWERWAGSETTIRGCAFSKRWC